MWERQQIVGADEAGLEAQKFVQSLPLGNIGSANACNFEPKTGSLDPSTGSRIDGSRNASRGARAVLPCGRRQTQQRLA
jgi:hypothetical protein